MTQDNPKEPSLINYRQLAEWISLPVGTIYSLVSKKRIPHVRLGPRLVRFHPGEINAWLAEQTRGGDS